MTDCFYAHSSVFWCLFPLLLCNLENKPQNNPLMSAETLPHSIHTLFSIYLIYDFKQKLCQTNQNIKITKFELIKHRKKVWKYIHMTWYGYVYALMISGISCCYINRINLYQVAIYCSYWSQVTLVWIFIIHLLFQWQCSVIMPCHVLVSNNRCTGMIKHLVPKFQCLGYIPIQPKLQHMFGGICCCS